jgi:hypothetical protein
MEFEFPADDELPGHPPIPGVYILDAVRPKPAPILAPARLTRTHTAALAQPCFYQAQTQRQRGRKPLSAGLLAVCRQPMGRRSPACGSLVAPHKAWIARYGLLSGKYGKNHQSVRQVRRTAPLAIYLHRGCKRSGEKRFFSKHAHADDEFI